MKMMMMLSADFVDGCGNFYGFDGYNNSYDSFYY